MHSSNTYLGIVDKDGKRVFKKKLSNDREVILNAQAPYKDNIAGIVVESTHNWILARRYPDGRGAPENFHHHTIPVRPLWSFPLLDRSFLRVVILSHISHFPLPYSLFCQLLLFTNAVVFDKIGNILSLDA